MDSSASLAHSPHYRSFWYGSHVDRKERLLIAKLDLFILTYTCLTFFVKYLDQSNITNAWAAGLSKDRQIRPHPNDLNLFTTYFNVGVIIGSLIFTPLLSVFAPSVILPGCSLVWSFCVLFMYKANNVSTLFALRFFAGLFEAVAYPGAFYIIGSWYQRHEINRRSSAFLFSSVFGGMTSGYIQAGLTQHLNGRLGIAAWRWLFIIDFIITIPVAIFGYFCCPNDPQSKRRVWWMSEEERHIAVERMRQDESYEALEWNIAALRRILKSWQLYSFVVAYAIMEVTCGTLMIRWFILFLLSTRQYHDKPGEVNNISTAVGGAQLVWLALAGILADALGQAWPVILILAALQLLAYIIFAVWPSNDALKFAMYFIGSSYEALPAVLMSWANVCCGLDRPLRSVTTGTMIALGYTAETLSQQFRFPTSAAPSYAATHGYTFAACWLVIFIIYACLLLPLIERRLLGVKRQPS